MGVAGARGSGGVPSTSGVAQGTREVGVQVTVRISPASPLHALQSQMGVTVTQRDGERAVVQLAFPGNQIIQVPVPDEALQTGILNINIGPPPAPESQPGV